MTTVVFLFSVLVSLAAFAQDESSPPSDLAAIRRISETFIEFGYEHPGMRLVMEVYEQEKQNSQPFSPSEVIVTAMDLLEKRSGKLKMKKFCFTCKMTVTTPDGERPIGAIRAGDRVYSWDFATQSLVINTVAVVIQSPDIVFSALLDPSSKKAPIETTGDHPFYSPDTGAFQPVQDIRGDQSLSQLTGTAPNCKLIFRPRGSFIPAGRGTVRTLQLGRSPHNFFVEGILVHNKTILTF